MHGRVALTFAPSPTGARVVHLEQRAPLRATFPRDPATGLPVAALVTTSGGIVGGDRHDIEVTAEAGARALVTTQAAEKVYRSAGADAHVTVTLAVGEGSWVEWVPQETILFEASRLVREMRVDLAADASLLAVDIVVFGRRARGETLTKSLLHDRRRVHCDSRLVWHDALRLANDIDTLLHTPSAFDGAVAAATLLYAAPDAPARLPALRQRLAEVTPSEVRIAATTVNGLLLCRALAADARLLREAILHVWMHLRATAGLPGLPPRLWMT
jgi:urease accessory protein